MPVNYEVKGMLAKLLATEDLIVEHKNVETAMFNVYTRVLTLPLWQKATNAVYDMLVGHEVSHALYSSEYNPQELNVPAQFVNITEDVRVEKLIKRRYMGLSKTFYKGYQELHSQDFFCLENQDVDKMNLADRVNLYFKIGNFIDISFTEKEKEIVDLVASSETFSDTVYAAKVLYEYCKEEEKDSANVEQKDLFNNQSSGSQFPNSDNDDNDDNGDNDGDSDEGETPENKNEQNTNEMKNNSQEQKSERNNDNIDIKTEKALKESIQNLITDNSFQENVYVEIPKVDLDTIIVKNKNVHEYIDEHFSFQKSIWPEVSLFKEADNQFNNFKISSQKEVNYLLKEFEGKKAADSYARSNISSTGVLDCGKLHTYKFNDDIFKRVTTLPNGKNHGLIFVLDWSGSMNNVILDTIKQLFSLIWFCKKVGIPFEVYAFSSEWNRIEYDKNNKPILLRPHYEKKEGLLCVEERFSMIQFFDSKVNVKQLENQMKNIWRICYISRNHTVYSCPPKLSLSGTPLNEAMISLYQIIPNFKNKNKVQKINCIILTDGEANFIPYHEKVVAKYNSKETYMRTRHLSYTNCYFRDRKTGNIYKIPKEFSQFTGMFLKNLKDNFPSVNFIGMRIIEPRDATHFISRYCGYDTKKSQLVIDQWRKDKSFSMKESGYDIYFGMSSSILSNDTSFEVHECATKAQIKSAFIKSLKTKKMNKKILGEFISLIV